MPPGSLVDLSGLTDAERAAAESEARLEAGEGPPPEAYCPNGCGEMADRCQCPEPRPDPVASPHAAASARALVTTRAGDEGQGPGRHRSLPYLHPAAWHGPAAEYVREVAPHTEADPLGVLVMLLAGLGSRLGPGAYVRIGESKHSALLWVLAVGRTATGRKGTAESVSLDRLSALSALPRRHSGLTSGEGVVQAFCATDDETQPETRLLITEGEWEGPLARARREGSTLSAVLRDAWDGKPLRTMNATNPREALTHHLTVVGHITPHALRTGMGDREAANGFLNRFLLLLVHRPAVVPFPSPVSDAANALLAGMVHTITTTGTGERQLTPTARDAYAAWYRRTEGEREYAPERVANATGRASGHLLRLALLLSVLDGCDAIDAEHIHAASAVTDYSAACAWHVYGPGQAGTDAKVLRALEAADPEPLTREGVRDALSRHVTADDLTDALTALEAASLITTTKEPTGGKPRTVIALTDAGRGRGSAVSAVSAEGVATTSRRATEGTRLRGYP